MTNNQILPKAPDHHSDIAIASIWVLMLAVIVAIEIGSLLVSHSMLAGMVP